MLSTEEWVSKCSQGNLEGGGRQDLRGTALTANGTCMRIHLFPTMSDIRASLVAQLVKNLRAMQETQVQSLEKEMATHSSVLA